MYAKAISGRETADDKQLFVLSTKVFNHISRIEALAKKKDIEGIHTTLYDGELYAMVDPTTACINRILDTKFAMSGKYRQEAIAAMQRSQTILVYASILAGILGLLVYRCKDPCLGCRFKKRKTYRKRKK